MDFDAKLDELYIDLPEIADERGFTVTSVLSGKELIIGGVLPMADGRMHNPGRLCVDVRLDGGRSAARAATICALSIASAALGGSLNKIKRVVRLDGAIAASGDFKDHEKVLDGASELLVQIFGSAGKHIRTAIGAASLPRGASVQISIIFEVK